jgi:single stranded DNA-binding protein
MTAALSLYGRLGQDPKSIATKSGKPMATASGAVEIPTRGDDAHSEWFGLVAFGEVAERLLKHQQGEMVSTSGRLQMNTWQDRESNNCQQWQILVDTLISARTVRPGTRQASNGQQQGKPDQRHQAPQRPADDFNDSIPF